MNATELRAASRLRLPDALLTYADLGLAVFPLPPRAKHWTGPQALDYRHATTDVAELNRMIADVDLTDPTRWPNIAMQPGRSGLVAVDVDGSAGQQSLHDLRGSSDRFRSAGYRTPRADGGFRLLYRMPDGARFGKRNPRPGLEVFGNVGHVVLPPSVHPNGGPYTWWDWDEIAPLPAELADLLGDLYQAPDEPTESATEAQVQQFLHGLPRVTEFSSYGRGTADKLIAELGAASVGHRHAACVHAAVRLLELAQAGQVDALAAVDELRAVFLQRLHGAPDRLPAAEFAGILRWSVAKMRMTTPAAPLANLITEAAKAYDDLDGDAVLFVLAIAATATLTDGTPPVWGALVGSSSGGKTGLTGLVCDAPGVHSVDKLTEPGLLSWSKGKTKRPVGLLKRIGSLGMVLVADFSTWLANSDYRTQEAVFSALRRVHDGRYARDLGEQETALSWEGRVTLLTGVTHAIDNFASYLSALGARWVYLRLRSRDPSSKRTMASKARRRRALDVALPELRKSAAELVISARERLPEQELPEQDIGELIDTVAVFTVYGRGSVPRSGYGRRDVLDLPDMEEPPRIAQALALLARAAFALGADVPTVRRLVLRCGVESIPRSRHRVLSELLDGEVLPVAAIAERINASRFTVGITCDDLRMLGLVTGPDRDEDNPGRQPRCYAIGGAAGDYAAEVLQAYRDETGPG